MTTAMTQEDERQYSVAREFIKLYPEYEATTQNNEKLLDWMELRNLRMTLEGIVLAYKSVILEEPEPNWHLRSPELFFPPEPEVMTPDLFFQKVTPGAWQTSTGSWEPPNDWKPPSTGLKADSVADMMKAFQNYRSTVVEPIIDLSWGQWGNSWGGTEWGSWSADPEKEPETEKPVAAMPTSWYSLEVVPVRTTRRIKDDL